MNTDRAVARLAWIVAFGVSFTVWMEPMRGIVYGQLMEEDRIVEYKKRNYTWPMKEFIPNTPGWKQLMSERLAQVERLSDAGDRYEGLYRTIHSACLAPNFTEFGFGLGHVPDEGLMTALKAAIREGLPTADEEAFSKAIDAPELPWLIHDKWGLTKRVLHELQPLVEAWSGTKLQAWGAYGFRLYRNQSQLYMHLDKMQTHIVSFILHIDSSDDAEPWPIFIEDFHGNTHEVILTPGDILFYESSKCFHGRPKRFNGSWYSSVFVHYYPADGWQDTNHELNAHYAIPPSWPKPLPPIDPNDPSVAHLPELELAGTSMREPTCPNSWCRTTNSKKWSGPGESGFWIAPTMERFPLVVDKPLASQVNDEL